MAIYNSYNPKMNIDANGKQITSTSIYQPSAKLPMTETDLMLQDLDLSKLESKGFDPKAVVTGKTLDQRIGKNAVKQAKLDSEIKTLPPEDGQGISTIGAANIATGISTAANVATSIYGAIQVAKMKPALSSFQAPIEAVQVADRSSAIKTAAEENIDKGINTQRSLYRRNGITGVDGILVSKNAEALNQLSGTLAQYRTGIDSQNAQTLNQTNQFNQSMEANKDQFNAQTKNQFAQYQSGLIGGAMKNATDSLASGTESIFGNMMAGKQMQLSSITSEMSNIQQQLSDASMAKSTLINYGELKARLQQLQLEKDKISKSVFGQSSIKI